MNARFVLALVAALIICVSFGANAEDATPLTEQVICEVDGVRADDIVLSLDLAHTAFVKSSGKGEVLVVDGKPGKEYPKVGRPVFSPDGKKVACVVKEGNNFRVLENGKAGPKYDEIDESLLLYDPTSKNLAYAAKKDGKEFVVLNGKEQGSYKGVLEFYFSEDGKQLACLVAADVPTPDIPGGTFPDEVWVVGGSVIDSCSMQSNFELSPNGKRWALIGGPLMGSMVNRDELGIHVVVDGEKRQMLGKSTSISLAGHGMFVFSPDSKKLAYHVEEKAGRFVYLETKKFGPYEDLSAPRFSPSGKSLVWLADSGKGMSLVVDGKAWATVGEDREEVQGHKMPITFRPVFDGDKSIAYVTGMFERQRVICNDEAHGEFTWVSNLQFDKQGELCYLAMGQTGACFMRGGQSVYEVDGVCTSMEFPGTSTIALAMDGTGNTALIASRDKVDELFVNGESVGIVGEHLESDDWGNRKKTALKKYDRGGTTITSRSGDYPGGPEGFDEAAKNAKDLTGLVRVIHIVWTGTVFRAVGIKDGKLTMFEYKP